MKKKLLYYKNLRLTDDYQYESEEERKEEKEEKGQQTSKKLNEWVNEKEKDINSELFQEHFRHQEPSNMLRDLCRINNKKKNNDLVNLIKSG